MSVKMKVCLFYFIFFFYIFQINFYANAQTETIPNWINVRQSPFNLVEPPDVKNPVLTPSDVTDVPAKLVADPFIFHEDNAWYMFFEVKHRDTDKKDIGLATSSDGLHWKYQKIVLSETNPLSYPLVLKSNGEYYMIPEANNWNQVRIYRANNFPYDWTYLTSIAHGRPFSDPSIFYYNNKWWMFVSKPGCDTLYLYYSNDLLSGWTEHPMSPVIEGDASRARPGGRSFVFDTDRIIRIAQKCDVTYGEQVRAFEVDILTEEDYAEHEIIESPLLKKSGVGWNAWAMHQFDPWWTGKEWICAVDGRGKDNWSIGIYIAKTPTITHCVANEADLIAALNAAKDNWAHDVIKIQQGTYFGNFNYTSPESLGVTIEGGYAFGCASRVVDPTNTVLDAQNNGVVLALSTPGVAADFVVDGLTLQNGNANMHGGGLYAGTNGAVTLINNTIKNNNSQDQGGGVYVTDSTSTVTLTNNTISNNSAQGQGGGIYFSSGHGTFTLTNNIISYNSAQDIGGGIWCGYASGTAVLTNNTISFNSAQDTGGGVRLLLDQDESISNIYNNIIWNNSAVNEGRDIHTDNDGDDNGIPATVNLYNNDFGQSENGTYIKIPFPVDPSNLNNADPLFVDPDNGDFHLTKDSPCIDAGTSENAPDTDIDGLSRPKGFGYDLGAHELGFADIAASYWAHDYIYKIYYAGITTGCSQNPLKYCPKTDVTREQMATFIIRAVDGEPDVGYCDTGSSFSDVSPESFFCKYIKRLSELEITNGCGDGNFCPKKIVTREQMAAFIIRAVDGEPPADYCATDLPFSDVSFSSIFCKYVKRLSELGITNGCGGSIYCPKTTASRSQMAAFLARAFLGMD